MNKHLLVTVGSDPEALHGARFAASFFKDRADVMILIFPLDPGAGGGPALAAREILAQSGLPRDNVALDPGPGQGESALRSALRRAAGLSDCIVLGQAGRKAMGAVMHDSLRLGLMREAWAVPAWICRAPDKERNGILACLDGSGPSYRALAHAASMLLRTPDQELTLLMIRRNGHKPGPEQESRVVFPRCREILKKHGLPQDRYHEREIFAEDPAEAIMTLAMDDGFKAVAMGRTGRDGGLLGEMHLGRVSLAAYARLNGPALWLAG